MNNFTIPLLIRSTIALNDIAKVFVMITLTVLCLKGLTNAAGSSAILLLQPRTAPADGAAQEALLKALNEASKTKLQCELISFTPVLPGIQLALRDGRITHREVSSPHKNIQTLLKCLGMPVGMWVRVAEINASVKSMANRITAVEVSIATPTGDTVSEFIDADKAKMEELAALESERGRSKRKVKPKVEGIPSMQLFVNAIVRRIKAALDTASLEENKALPTEDEFAQLLSKARMLLKEGKLEEAAALYRKLAMLSPGIASLYVELGEVYERMKRFNDALIEYERATRVDRKCVDAWRRLAELQYSLGRVEDAWHSVQELINLSPDNARHLLLAARVARLRSSRLGRINGTIAIEMRNIARHYYQRAIELEPNEEVAIEASEFILEVQRTNGRRSAVELLRAFLSRAKDDKLPLKALSMCLSLLIQMNQLDEAYGVFKRVLGDEPDENLLRQMPYELVGEMLDARWAQVYEQVNSLLSNFWRKLISREDALEELSWLSSDAERIAAMARKLEPPEKMRRSHDRRLLCYDLFSQAIAVAKLYIETGDPIHQRRAYLLMQNAYSEWKALHSK
ncbi:MAG: hypothetical protein RMK18_01510 [Armatimonadota bacterium]|nr:hypothetical protein [Armatimonadota bacterium]MDW8024532.1 hypothetical protein [Armatimonadota bacterium]